MKAVIQRVKSAHVEVAGDTVGQIGQGLLVLLGISHEDTTKECHWLAEKIVNLRLFSDSNEKMNLSVKDLEFQVLVVSQFTLYGNCLAGRRPDFLQAAPPAVAEPLYRSFVQHLQKLLQRAVPTGVFGAKMQVHMVGDGPVTFLIDSGERKKRYSEIMDIR